MNRVLRLGMVLGLVFLTIFVPGRALFAMGTTAVLRVGCPDLTPFPDDSPERLLFTYTKTYLDEIARSTGWQYEYVPMEERTAREMLQAGKIDLYFPEETIHDAEGFVYSRGKATFTVLAFYVRGDRDAVQNEPAALEGMRVGILTAGSHAAALEPFVRDQGIQIQTQAYESTEEMHEALARGEVDAIVDTVGHKRQEEKMLLRLALLPASFVTADKRAGLLRNLSEAIYRTETINPSFETHLGQLFLDRAQGQLVRFTPEENDYREQEPTLRIVYVRSHAPFFGEHIEERVPDGIYPNVLKAMGETIGLSFQFVRAADNEQALKMLREGQADLLFCVYNNLPSMQDMRFTSTFVSEPFSYVVRRGMSDLPEGEVRVAVPRWFFGTRVYLGAQHPNWTIVPVDNPSDGLRLVEEEDCDFALMPLLFLQRSGLLSLHPGLVVLAGRSAEIPVSLAISNAQPHILQSVLTKGILKLDPRRVQEIVNAHMTSRMTLTSIVALYPVQTVVLVSIVLLALFGAAAFFYRSRLQSRQSEILLAKNVELEAAIAEQKILMRARDVYKQEAEVDALTGLLNKRSIGAACTETLKLPLKEGAFHAFFIMDLDHFKEVNDTLGHQYGDDVLRRFAQEARGIFRDSDYVGRFGGDEFTVLMTNVTSFRVVQRRARQLLTAARELEIRDDRSFLSVSIGIAFAPQHGTTYDELFHAADNALYEVKRAGRNGWKIYGEDQEDGGEKT